MWRVHYYGLFWRPAERSFLFERGFHAYLCLEKNKNVRLFLIIHSNFPKIMETTLPKDKNLSSNLRLNSHDSSLLEHLDRMMTTSEKNCNPGGLWLTSICCHLVSDLPTFILQESVKNKERGRKRQHKLEEKKKIPSSSIRIGDPILKHHVLFFTLLPSTPMMLLTRSSSLPNWALCQSPVARTHCYCFQCH